MKKTIAWILISIMCLCLLAGCAAPAAPVAQEPAPATQEPAPAPAVEEPVAEQPEEPASEEITVTDVTGRSVTFAQPATAIVGTHNPSLNTAIVLGGGGDYLAGFGNKQMANGLYGLVIENWDGVPQIGKGKEINYEAVAVLGDNLVAILPERFADQAESYEQIGVPAVVALPNTESFDTIKSSLALVAQVLGLEDRAVAVNAFFDEKIAAAKEIGAKSEAKPSVLFLGSSSQLSVATSAMIQTEIIDTAGGINAVSGVEKAGDFAEVSIEEIIGWDPEVIWIPSYAKYTVDDLMNDPAWADITAIKNNAVYVFPSALEPWDYPSASACLGVCWAVQNLHPDLYTQAQLMADVDGFYDLVYGQTFTAEQLGL
ncbi:MAG: ABC transporter substrate-binding protein [Clostridia bacterium]|nr:ABC transporter substrate-binding protein [Clostridia bacterium]